MKELILDEINQIQNLEERVIFKDLMNQVFIALYESNLEMYQQLEEKIYNEVAYDSRKYVVISGLIEKKYFDESHHIFAPILKRDVKAEPFDLELIKNKLKQKKSMKIMHVFMECDYLQLKKMIGQNLSYSGHIKTNQGSYQAEFSLRPNTEYLEEIHHLYKLFVRNGIPWKTVNHPYIYKIVDVYLEQCDVPMEMGPIKEISVDFKEYNQFVRYDMMPVWNIVREETGGVGFPVACEDHQNYEHRITLEERDKDYAYLVENKNVYIQDVQVKEDQLLVVCDTDEIQKWTLYKMMNKRQEKTDYFSYPTFSNLTNDQFIGRFQSQNPMSVKTTGELMRFLGSFELEHYLVFEGIEITDRSSQKETEETYSMNHFMIDEIRQPDAKKSLILSMSTKDKIRFLARDILSFLVSEIQLIYPEYDCRGKLI